MSLHKLCKIKLKTLEGKIELQFKINILVIAEVKDSETQIKISIDYPIKVLNEENKTLNNKLNVI